MKPRIILLISILLLALFLRVFGITWGLPSKDYYFSYYGDETHYIKGLSQMDPARFKIDPGYYNWGTWHYYQLGSFIGSASLLNIVKLVKDKKFYYSNPREMAKIFLAGRVLSVFFALGTIILVYLIASRLFGANAGLLSAFFMAINPAHVVHSHILKADTSVTFWITLMLFISILLVETGKLKWYVLAGITSAVSMSTQQNGFCFAHTLFIAHILRQYMDTKKFSFKGIICSKNLVWGYLAMCCMYLIASPFFMESFRNFMAIGRDIINAEGVSAHGEGFFTRLVNTWIGTTHRSDLLIDSFKAFSMALTPFFVFLGIGGLLYGIKSGDKRRLLILAWLLPYLLIMLITGGLETRYQMLIFPGLFILGAGAICCLYSSINSRALRYTLIIVLSTASFYTSAYSYAYDSALSKRAIQDQASDWLVSEIPFGTEIAISGAAPEIRNNPSIIHQSYYYTDNPHYRVVALNYKVASLKKENPEYAIISKREGFGEKNYPRYNVEFVRELKRDYKVIKSFKRFPSIFNVLFEPDVFDSDWELPFPVIYILQKKNL